MQQKINKINFWLDTILRSYSQLFFSLNRLFACIIFIVTFFDFKLGCIGFLSVVLINVFAQELGLNKQTIQQGIYGFNALLLGIGLGYTYQINFSFCVLFVISNLFLLIISVWLEGVLLKVQIPFLVFPFLFVYWITSVATSSFSYIQLDTNRLYNVIPNANTWFYKFTHLLNNIELPIIVMSYFKTLISVFFQNSILGGILISVGLLLHSRISFSLSIIGFIAAYYSFQLLGADTNLLTNHMLGSNFIFMAIAIGGFFILPNIYSYLVVVVLTPILMLLLFFTHKILLILHLSSFTISFSILVSMFLYFLHQRRLQKYLKVVSIQYYSAEKTIYKHISTVSRFENYQQHKMALPFYGKWKVSQGYNGKITHLGDWQNALDFVIVNEQGNTHRDFGKKIKEYYCYNKPVIAPSDGYVHSIVNSVEDNEIADVNIKQNWGNAIVLYHSEGLYSQISHIKKDSFKVKVGDYVSKGTILASCGNSGRSPEPHIHFQIQKTPKTGEKTLSYPLAYFIEENNGMQVLKISEIPKENALISNVQTTPLLQNAFDFTPGKIIKLTDENCNLIEWEVFTDAWNRTYIYCALTQSYAYFTNDNTMIYFYDFEGDTKSLLFYFFLAFYRILLGYYQDLEVKDQLPLIYFNNKFLSSIQDFFAPFYMFTKTTYQSSYHFSDDAISPERIELSSSISTVAFSHTIKKIEFKVLFKKDKIEQFLIINRQSKQLYKCEY